MISPQQTFALAFGGYLALNLYALFFSERLIFVPQPRGYDRLPDEVRIPTPDGANLAAVFMEAPAADYVILFSHGNAEDLGAVQPFVRQYLDLGVSVLAYDYRGYGASEGRPSVRNAKRDVEAAYRWLTQTKGFAPERIVLAGRSLGGGPSTWLAARRPVGGLILESTFVSAFRVKTVLPLLPWDYFNNLRAMRRVRCPVLVLHGTRDEIIPFWHGRKLYAAAPEPKTLFPIESGTHFDYAYVAGENYLETYREFFARLRAPGVRPPESMHPPAPRKCAPAIPTSCAATSDSDGH